MHGQRLEHALLGQSDAGMLGIQLAVMAVFGLICAGIASSRGRNPVGWFFIGLVAPCIGLILVLVLPDLKVEAERQKRLVRENRRLREITRKDRMVADQRHAATKRRLGAHDVALSVDTSEDRGQLAGGVEPPVLPPVIGPERGLRTSEWFYARAGKREGPVAFETLQELWDGGVLRGDSLVWTAGMDEWTPIGDVPDLAGALGG